MAKLGWIEGRNLRVDLRWGDDDVNHIRTHAGELIRDRFGTRWVFSDNTKDHADFFDQALKSGWFDRVYEDKDCSVLQIRDEKGEPPPETKANDSDNGDDDDQDNSP